MRVIGVIACVAVCLAACSEDQGTEPVFVDEHDSGRAIVLSIGQDLVVTLASNPTTGYSWSYQSSSGSVLRPGKYEYVGTQPVLPGSGGEERFAFTGAETGRTTLRFEYRRPWETEEPPIAVVTFEVAVR